MKKTPLRMCIACREMKAKNQMLRVVRTADGEIKVDYSGKLNGRGAYLCDSEDCFKKLGKGKLLNRAFSTAVPDEVYESLTEAYLAKK